LRDNERLEKLKKNHLRNNGIDIISINQQINDKKIKKINEKLNEKKEYEQNLIIEKYLINLENEKLKLKKLKQNELNNEWNKQINEKINLNIIKNNHDNEIIKPNECSLGAAQKFDGEDLNKDKRIELQKLQIKKWNNEIYNEKLNQKLNDKLNDKNELNQINQNIKLQQELNDNIHKYKINQNIKILNDNKILALNKMEQNEKIKLNDEIKSKNEIDYLLYHDNLLNENVDKYYIKSSSSSSSSSNNNNNDNKSIKIRKDHYKGLSKNEISTILNYNEIIKNEKKQKYINEKLENEKYLMNQTLINKNLELNEYLNLKSKINLQQNVNLTLNQQIIDAKEREIKSKNLSKGKIDKEFFNSFGKSYR